jgi:hypothetical protein
MCLSKSLKDIHKTKPLYKSDLTSNIQINKNKKFYSSVSPAMSLLKSKQIIDERKSEAIKNSCNKSFDSNGNSFYYFQLEIWNS